jgi:multisubunit Na+/H+ antiporter MnhB subunit
MANKLFLTISILVMYLASSAQNDIEMADQFRAEGKIYVVIGVILIVLAGLFTYLFATDRKLKQLEKEIYKNKN